MKKVSEFLSDIDPWGIYISKDMKADFTKETGKEDPNWPEHTARQTAEAILNRGLGGRFDPTPERLCYGWEVAKALAGKFAPGYHCTKIGRGFAFREAVQALLESGN